MRRILIKSAYNMRDLGGHPTYDGKVTRFGRIFRSDCPTEFTDTDVMLLKEKGIGTAIDLRVRHELEKWPSAYSTNSGFSYHNCPFATGDRTPVSQENIPFTYLELFEEFENIRQVLDIIADSEDAVVYHCAVGKDRTGVITAIILSICSVPEEDLLADYQVSYTYLKHLIRKIKEQKPEWPEWAGRSEMEYMEDALGLLLRKYGSFDGYLKTAGISENTVEKIRRKLLD